jgi:hypothetical protein
MFFGDRTCFTLGIRKWQGNRVLVVNGPMILRVLYKTTPPMGGGVSSPFRDVARLATNRLPVQKRVHSHDTLGRKRTAAKSVFWGRGAYKLSLEGSPALAVPGT